MAYAGPIPFPVLEGGSGDSSHTAYAVLAGGTTSTGAVQSVSGVGTTGQVLTSNGAAALPTWQTGSGGNLVLIQSQTVSGAASVVFTTGITATYNNYAFLCSNVNTSVATALALQISTNGGSSYITTAYSGGQGFLSYGGTTWSTASSTTGLQYGTMGGGAQPNFGFWTWCWDITNGSYPLFMMMAGGNINSQASCYNTNTTVNAFRYLPASGTISGNFTLYGLLE